MSIKENKNYYKNHLQDCQMMLELGIINNKQYLIMHNINYFYNNYNHPSFIIK